MKRLFFPIVGLMIMLAMLIPAYAQLPGCTVNTDLPVYTVQRGDTLARIARRYNTTVNTLVQLNCIANPNLIFAGQQIRLPYSGGTIIPPNPTIPPSSYTVHIAYQLFENGFMTWRSDTGDIWVYYGQSSGTTALYPAYVYGNLPENRLTIPVPANRYMPILGFGRVWANYAQVTALGWGLSQEQHFNSTFMLHATGFTFSLPDGSAINNSGGMWTNIPPAGTR
jgi:LysM repeat protein